MQVQSLCPDAAAIERLRCIAFLDDYEVIEGPKTELPSYLAECNGFRNLTNEEKGQWWGDYSAAFPCWATAARKILLLQVSFAAAERAFSMLISEFGQQRLNALTDYLQTSVMLRFNHRKV